MLEDMLVNIDKYLGIITLFHKGDLSVLGLVLLDVTGHPEESLFKYLQHEKNYQGWFFFLWASGPGHGEKSKKVPIKHL